LHTATRLRRAGRRVRWLFRRPPRALVILGRARHRRVEGRGSSAGLVEDAVEPSALLTLDPGTALLFVCARRLRYAEPGAEHRVRAGAL